jgi:prephenate dehydrogenase
MTVGVVTLGLIRGSLALALRDRGIAVSVWDRNPTTRATARETGLTVFDELEDLAASGVDLLVVASPLFAMSDIMVRIARTVPPHATITDAGSVKERVRESVNAAGLGSQYVGAHPMAGTEKSGFAHADPHLFDGATWGLTLAEETELTRALLVLQFITRIMSGRALVTTDRIHDDSVALVSHLPHVLAHSLTGIAATSPNRELAVRLAAGSFRDGTRVARGSATRNQAMIVDNSRAVLGAVDRAIELLTDVRDALDATEPGTEELTEFFTRGAPIVERASDGEASESEVSLDHANWAEQLLAIGATGSLVTGITVGADVAQGITVNVRGNM